MLVEVLKSFMPAMKSLTLPLAFAKEYFERASGCTEKCLLCTKIDDSIIIRESAWYTHARSFWITEADWLNQ
jgi:hypothetical protein